MTTRRQITIDIESHRDFMRRTVADRNNELGLIQSAIEEEACKGTISEETSGDLNLSGIGFTAEEYEFDELGEEVGDARSEREPERADDATPKGMPYVRGQHASAGSKLAEKRKSDEEWMALAAAKQSTIKALRDRIDYMRSLGDQANEAIRKCHEQCHDQQQTIERLTRERDELKELQRTERDTGAKLKYQQQCNGEQRKIIRAKQEQVEKLKETIEDLKHAGKESEELADFHRKERDTQTEALRELQQEHAELKKQWERLIEQTRNDRHTISAQLHKLDDAKRAFEATEAEVERLKGSLREIEIMAKTAIEMSESRSSELLQWDQMDEQARKSTTPQGRLLAITYRAAANALGY